MKKEWSSPSVTDLSVLQTEAAIKSNPIHDGVFYDTQYGDFEGHKS
ncbi:MAG: hypothetical protein K0R54_4325 [Clostridiaceae bacterium]|jgi:hypothetical protein|nr:hypothetical protein [Clostridiaceae bacterium]